MSEEDVMGEEEWTGVPQPQAPSAVLALVARIAEGFAATPDLRVLDRKDRAVLLEDAGGNKLMIGVQLCK